MQMIKANGVALNVHEGAGPQCGPIAFAGFLSPVLRLRDAILRLTARPTDRGRAVVLSNTEAHMGKPAMYKARLGAIGAGGLSAVSGAAMERWFGPAFRPRTRVVAWHNRMMCTWRDGDLGRSRAIFVSDLWALTAALILPVRVVVGCDAFLASRRQTAMLTWSSLN